MADEETPIEELPPAPEEGGGDDKAPAAAPAQASGGGSSPWIPVLVMIIVFPVLIFVMVDFVIIPRMQNALSQVVPGSAKAHSPAASAAGQQEEAAAEVPEEGLEYQNFEFKDIVANLAGSMQTRYIKTTFTVAGNDPQFIEIMEKNRAKLVDATLRILSGLTIKDLDHPGVQNTVRSDLLALFDAVLKKKVIKEIYFSEFVAQ
tara:strand:- start:1912 stop:2523 length:612 start_codon:yes stop_codon:yes gene_type:complete